MLNAAKLKQLTTWFMALNVAQISQVTHRIPMPDDVNNTMNLAIMGDVLPEQFEAHMGEELSVFNQMVDKLHTEVPGVAFKALIDRGLFGATPISKHAVFAAFAYAGTVEEVAQQVVYTAIMRQILLAKPDYQYKGVVDDSLSLFELNPDQVSLVDFSSSCSIGSLFTDAAMVGFYEAQKFTEEDGTVVNLLDEVTAEDIDAVARQYAWADVEYEGRLQEPVAKLAHLYTTAGQMGGMFASMFLEIGNDQERLVALLDQIVSPADEDEHGHVHGENCGCGEEQPNDETEPSAG